MNIKPIVFSGVQPSGKLTIGNYFGSILQWVELQNRYQCMYCIVDLHTITNYRNNSCSIHEMSLDTLALFLACGIDPEISTIFVQSHVLEHSQLNWLLSNCVFFGELSRMIQFKEKSKQYKSDINIGLLNYPVLMAADILLYQTNLVPVGEDQRQHLELTRNIAKRFNNRYGMTFTIPEILIPVYGSRIMSLLHPQKKMSKSDLNSNSYIALLDDIDMVSSKIKRAVTDSDQPPAIYYDPKKKPGISNLLEILSRINNKSIQHLEKVFKGKTYFQLKTSLIQELSLFLINLQNLYYKERSNESKLNNILRIGAKKARVQASVTLNKVHKMVGFL